MPAPVHVPMPKFSHVPASVTRDVGLRLNVAPTGTIVVAFRSAPDANVIVLCTVSEFGPVIVAPLSVKFWTLISCPSVIVLLGGAFTIASYVNPPLPLFGNCATFGVFDQLAATFQLAAPPIGIHVDVTSAARADQA